MSRIGAAVLWIAMAACSRPGETLTVSLAASLQAAIREIAPRYQREHTSPRLVLNFGASGMLAQQIEQGAPADVFFSAAPQPMDTLAARGLIVPGSRRDLLRNRIVLIAPATGGPRGFQELPEVKLIAMGDPGTVPAGDYGRQALIALGLWERVQTRLVLAKDVRQVLTYVENGEAGAGIVYATDARGSAGVRVVEVAPESSHRPVVYPIAVLKSRGPIEAARGFVEFLSSAEAKATFERHGFIVTP